MLTIPLGYRIAAMALWATVAGASFWGLGIPPLAGFALGWVAVAVWSGVVAGMLAAHRKAWQDAEREMLWLTLRHTLLGVVWLLGLLLLLLPILVGLAIAFWAILALPVMLLRSR